MTRLLLVAFFSFFLLNANLGLAAEATPPPVKIGVVDMQTVATESEPAKAAKTKMEAKYGKEKADLEKQGAALKKQAEGLKNPKTSEQKKIAFMKAKQKLDQDTRSFLRKVEQDEVKLRQDMVTLVFNATYEVAKAQGYTFVVDITAGGVLYADQSMDLTKAVMAEVNRIYAQNNAKQADAPAPADAKK